MRRCLLDVLRLAHLDKFFLFFLLGHALLLFRLGLADDRVVGCLLHQLLDLTVQLIDNLVLYLQLVEIRIVDFYSNLLHQPTTSN